MCTQQEVRDVIREANPAWTRYIVGLFGAGMIALLSWLTLAVHEQDANMEKGLSELRITNSLNNNNLANRIDILSNQLINLKEVAISRSGDRYTGTQARSRNLLVDERCKVVDRRLKEIEELISKHHIFNGNK